eukprot:45354-Rhodomonas_salina.1
MGRTADAGGQQRASPPIQRASQRRRRPRAHGLTPAYETDAVQERGESRGAHTKVDGSTGICLRGSRMRALRAVSASGRRCARASRAPRTSASSSCAPARR